MNTYMHPQTHKYLHMYTSSQAHTNAQTHTKAFTDIASYTAVNRIKYNNALDIHITEPCVVCCSHVCVYLN